ncbi:S-adenosyl-L-methionine-dependent methyltransferase [Suhomyces tanzawaensis NRRL Y-17324]|uniref:S-adenosyl-L-methionine-dependent methyltransferase n=1 Tax=Suhomyces tanzawaensis NRRL Y-17324 TaxID=984487 RepID=A0A1E4SKG2_9ASCO|nr:S-adenosyl-L-methionine-dependent methyltransferase [Suhomyces tanzawaensis NRRL Y-17324]ODV79988.1 S-adenosyl-L-methionine-dependent methyltransferase [Suhomyces tanzawaensis NRRL Y-17324]
MGKRNFRNNKGGDKKNFGKRGVQDRDASWTDAVRENEKWETYYKAMNIIPEDEWDSFKKHCQENLPMTFRITGSRAHANEINDIFTKNHVAKLQDVEFEGVKLQPKNLAYYPGNLGWQIDVSKGVIRKNKEFADTQRFLVIETEVGNISRQEAVSMIPPLLMDIKPHHNVLDMCAAPGSKTAQLVEALHAEEEQQAPTGFVLANDSDYKRSHMLVHQVKRLNSANFMVVNHDAQLFPRMKLKGSNDFLKFDRILCDVPCSGDATMRKNVNVWKDFTVNNALGLHTLQVNILNRGLQLLKKGGRLVYSTCSLSPVENEAVVAAALRRWGKQIRLVNCDDELPGLIRRKGLNDWKVFSKDMTIQEKGAEGIAESVFPSTEEEAKEFNLENCMRVYPHLQNTGGFFITVFEKIDPAGSTKRSGEEEAEEASKKQKVETEDSAKPQQPALKHHPQRKEKMPRDANEEPFIFLDQNHEQLSKCWPFYDISESFARECTLVRNATGEPLRTIYYVSPVLKRILDAEEQKLKIIHAGIKLFVSQRNDTGNCPWRVQNESLQTIKPFLGTNRQLTCNLKLLEMLFVEAFPKINDIRTSGIDAEFSAKLDEMSEGCVFLTVNRGEGLENLFLPLWKGKSNVNLMVNKKDTHELLYRVFGISTSSKDEGKEAIYQKKLEAVKAARESTEPESAQDEGAATETEATPAVETESSEKPATEA